MEGRTDGRTDGQTDVRTYVHDVMAIKPNFLTSMGYHIFLAMVRARSSTTKINVQYTQIKINTNYEYIKTIE